VNSGSLSARRVIGLHVSNVWLERLLRARSVLLLSFCGVFAACTARDTAPRPAAAASLPAATASPAAKAEQVHTAPPAATATTAITPRAAPYVLAGTEVHQLASKTNGRSYEIAVGPAYKNTPGQRHATVYVLDGYWDFALVNTLRGALQYDEAIPDVIVVGIGYSGLTPDAAQIQELRASDYTPTPVEKDRPGSGRAPEFLRFLSDELVPFIESRYPADPEKRVLAGVSFGGLFALYTLFERPELFSGYLAMAPAIRWDDSWIARREREFHKTHPALPARLWLSVGSDDEAPRVKAAISFFQQLEASRYRDLKLRTRVVEGERHAGMKTESYNRGLRFVLSPFAAKPSH
jgi:predicted alpha/beta superfamily hydrolase